MSTFSGEFQSAANNNLGLTEDDYENLMTQMKEVVELDMMYWKEVNILKQRFIKKNPENINLDKLEKILSDLQIQHDKFYSLSNSHLIIFDILESTYDKPRVGIGKSRELRFY